MKSITIKNAVSNQASLSADELRASVLAHQRYLESISVDMHRVAKRYLHARFNARTNWIHPSLNLPRLVLEKFPCADSLGRKQITEAFIAADHFTHLLDDVMDEPGDRLQVALTAHASHLLLMRASCLYQKTAVHPEATNAKFMDLVAQAMFAERAMWSRKDTWSDASMIASMSARGCISQMVVFAAADLSDQWCRADDVASAIDYFISGIQLLDEAVDVREDFLNGTTTFPMLLAGLKATSNDWEEFSHALIRSGALVHIGALGARQIFLGAERAKELGLCELAKVGDHLCASWATFCSALGSHFDQGPSRALQAATSLVARINLSH